MDLYALADQVAMVLHCERFLLRIREEFCFESEGVLSVVNDIYVCFQLAYTVFNDAVTSAENT